MNPHSTQQQYFGDGALALTTHSSADAPPNHLDQSTLQLLAARQHKKNNKALASAITCPMSAALHALTSSDPADALAMEKAIVLRAKKPQSTTLEQIYRNPALLKWDHGLVLACVQAQFDLEIARLKTKQTPIETTMATSLEHSLDKLSGRLIRDQLKISAPAMATSLSSMFTADPSMLTIHSQYERSRLIMMNDPENRVDSIARIDGICIRFNIKNDCFSDNCGYEHRCIICGDASHGAWKCVKNPHRWDPSKLRKRNNNNNNSYNRNRGRGRGRGFGQKFSRAQPPPNFPPPHYHQYDNQGYPNWYNQQGYPSKGGNRGRYNDNNNNKKQ